MKHWNKKFDKIFWGTIIFYGVLMLWILLFKYVSPWELFSADRPFNRSLNLIPFQTIKNYLFDTTGISKGIIIDNILGNIILFIPLGIYLQLLKRKKRIFLNVLVVFIISLAVEFIQFAFGIGATDIDDIILNCLGGIVGILLYNILLIPAKNEEKLRNIIILVGAIVAIPLCGIVILLLIFN